MEFKELKPYAFERACGIANGYLGKQFKGKGSVGSDILEKIAVTFPELDLTWLITGKGPMINKPARLLKREDDEKMELQEEEAVYKIRRKLIGVLKNQLEELEMALPDRAKNKKRPKKKN